MDLAVGHRNPTASAGIVNYQVEHRVAEADVSVGSQVTGGEPRS